MKFKSTILIVFAFMVLASAGCKQGRTGYLINANGITGGVLIDKSYKFVKVVVTGDTIAFYGDNKLIIRSWGPTPKCPAIKIDTSYSIQKPCYNCGAVLVGTGTGTGTSTTDTKTGCELSSTYTKIIYFNPIINHSKI